MTYPLLWKIAWKPLVIVPWMPPVCVYCHHKNCKTASVKESLSVWWWGLHTPLRWGAEAARRAWGSARTPAASKDHENFQNKVAENLYSHPYFVLQSAQWVKTHAYGRSKANTCISQYSCILNHHFMLTATEAFPLNRPTCKYFSRKDCRKHLFAFECSLCNNKKRGTRTSASAALNGVVVFEYLQWLGLQCVPHYSINHRAIESIVHTLEIKKGQDLFKPMFTSI